MAPIPLNLPTQSMVGRDGQSANTHVINAYAEQTEGDGKSPFALYGAPGLTRWDSGGFSGPERGMIALDDTHLIAVLGNQVVKFDVNGTPTVIGFIPGTGRVIMAIDRELTRSIAVVTNLGVYYLITGGNTVTLQSNPNLPAPNSVTYLAGHFLYSISDGRIFCSAIDDGTTINAGSFATCNQYPQKLSRVYAFGGYAYCGGTKATEIWQPDATLAASPFPFSNTLSTVPLGILAPYSIAELDQGLVWVDNFGMVQYGSPGSGAQRISTHMIERAIASLSPTDQQNITGYVIAWEGHKCYVLSSSQWTFLYDNNNPGWVERKSYGSNAWMISNAVLFNGKFICGNANNGKLYYVDPENYTEDGNNLTMEIWCGSMHRFPGQMIADKLSLDVVAGIGLQTGNLADTDPHILIDYSDDGGKTFKGETARSLGQIGVYTTTIETHRWGLIRQKGRIWRFRATIAAIKAILQAQVSARAVRPSVNQALMDRMT